MYCGIESFEEQEQRHAAAAKVTGLALNPAA